MVEYTRMKAVRIEPLKSLGKKTETSLRDDQLEAARCWSLCVETHKTARNTKQPWPGLNELHAATRGKFQLAAQTVQQIIRAFLGSVTTTRKLKAKGYTNARYPHKEKRFFPIMWPSQAVAVYEKKIVLPMGRGRKSIVLPRPPEMPDSGAAARIVWNGVGYELHWALDVPEQPPVVSEVRATVDLGQIHQAAVSTNTGKALIVSGRAIRSEKRGTNMMHGRMARKQKRCEKYSRRWWRLQRVRNRHALQFDRSVRDLRHKGIRAVIDFCATHEVGRLFVGNPHGVRKASKGRQHSQRMAQWEYGKDIQYLGERATLAGIECFNGSERGTSSHCPRCGYKKKPSGRNWSCPRCGFKGHRDIVGSVNMHELAFGQQIEFPVAITYLRPGQKSFWQAVGMKNPRLGSSSGPDTGHERRASGARVAERASGSQLTHGCGAALAAGSSPSACNSEAHPL